MNARTLPHPSDLQAGQALLEVQGYLEYDDAFICKMHDASPRDGRDVTLPAPLLPMLVHEYGEPDEFVGRTFLIERGAKKADYAHLYSVLTNIVEDTQLLGSRDKKPVDAVYIDAGARALNTCPDPHTL